MSIATTVREKPVLFRGEMVLGILDGRKTQTRRVMKPQPRPGRLGNGEIIGPCEGQIGGGDYHVWQPPHGCQKHSAIPLTHGCMYRIAPECPYGEIEDRLWVKETFSDPFHLDVEHKNFTGFFRASDPGRQVKWRSAATMPRWACRIVLEITDVRVERLNDISHEDALAEGCEGYGWVPSSPYFGGPHTDDGELPQEEFQTLWESINGAGSWAKNEWVWVISFKRIDQ